MVGRPALDFLDEENKAIMEEQIESRKKGEHRPYEIEWTTKDGRRVPTILSPRGFFEPDGRYRGAFGVVTDISEQKKTEQALREREKELEGKTARLEENDKIELQERVLHNIQELVTPYLQKLKKSALGARQEAYVGIIESHLEDVTSSFSPRLSSEAVGLSPMELQVADLIRQGRTTKDISELLDLSKRTIDGHRDRIRRKLGIKNAKVNLRAYLQSKK
jgi:DNA-binding CsgD family transcriptional regulator